MSIKHALREEFANFSMRLLLADALVFFLPRLSFNRLRTAIYRMVGVDIGPRSVVFGRLTITGTGAVRRRLHIGADCIINAPLFLDLSAEIHIGDRVSIGHHCVFVTSHHDVGVPEFRAGVNTARPIRVEEASWIAARSTVLPGISIGRSSIVASGAVVARDVPANVLVGGVPARLIRSLPEK